MRQVGTISGGAPGGARLATFGALALLLSACGVGDLPGYYFDLKVVGLDDSCSGAPANFKDQVEVRVDVDGEDVVLAVGPDEFATGRIDGCTLNYQSVVWGEEVDGYDIRWQIIGNAVMNPGGNSCNTGNGTDWSGQEYYEVVNSEDPTVFPGCSYDVSLSGKFIKEVK